MVLEHDQVMHHTVLKSSLFRLILQEDKETQILAIDAKVADRKDLSSEPEICVRGYQGSGYQNMTSRGE